MKEVCMFCNFDCCDICCHNQDPDPPRPDSELIQEEVSDED